MSKSWSIPRFESNGPRTSVLVDVVFSMAIEPSVSAVWDHWVETEPFNPPTIGLVAVKPTVIVVELLNDFDQELEVPTMMVFV